MTAATAITAPALVPAAYSIKLTDIQAKPYLAIVHVRLNELIAYSQNLGFTRLTLTGGKTIDVKETTDQIDRLVRAAASQFNSDSDEF